MAQEESAKLELKDVLLREGVVTLDNLNNAFREQEKTKEQLLEIIIRSEKFEEAKLYHVLTHHYGYLSVNPSMLVIDQALLDMVPKKLAEKYLALPISQLDKTLTVAFANPTNLKAIDEIRAVSGKRIKTMVAKVSLLKKYIGIFYAQKQQAASDAAQQGAEGGQDKLEDLVKMIEVERVEDEAAPDTSDLMKVALETPVIKLVNTLLTEGIRRGASDIFIEPWETFIRVRARVDGLLEEIVRPQKALGAAIVSRIKIMSELDIAEHRVPQDGRFKVKMKGREVDMRVSILPTTYGEKVCLRILDTKSQSHDISRLGFNEREQTIIKDCARRPHGMILVTGPTGSGKTTTLYSVLKYLHSPDVNLTTVEDPVEYQLPGINQVNVKEHIGLTFPASLRSILRQDPDIILIGEIRDAETLDIAVKAALTGHLVLSTLHTNDATTSITRMINMGLEPFLIASTVLMISAQRLVRKLCHRCRVSEQIDPAVLKELELSTDKPMTFYHAKGCNQCRQTGYSGRSVITEIMKITPELRDMIMEGKSAGDIKTFAHTQGMTTLRECAIRKALDGETSLEEVFRVTTKDQELEQEEEAQMAHAEHLKIAKKEKAA